MSDYRIKEHPILPVPGEAVVPLTWKGQAYKARQGETIASALFANGIRIFGHAPELPKGGRASIAASRSSATARDAT